MIAVGLSALASDDLAVVSAEDVGGGQGGNGHGDESDNGRGLHFGRF